MHLPKDQTCRGEVLSWVYYHAIVSGYQGISRLFPQRLDSRYGTWERRLIVDFHSRSWRFVLGNIQITAVIPVKNEEQDLPGCLESLVGFADEVLVVDDGSTDATIRVAEDLGARVVIADRGERPIEYLFRRGFEEAQGVWIIALDADERMSETLARRLKEIVAEGRYAGVRYARRNIMFGDWARHGGWFQSGFTGFIRADAWDRQWTCEIHTRPDVRGELLTLPADEALSTLHLDYDSVEQYVRRTLLRYAKTEASAAYLAGRRFSRKRLLVRPTTRFLGRLLVRQGFRDGTRGLILAGLMAASDFCVEANLWDIERRANPAPYDHLLNPNR